MITYEELQQWIDELKLRCSSSHCTETYKLGYTIALIDIEIKMDKVKKHDQKA